jgi:hypothetical protein
MEISSGSGVYRVGKAVAEMDTYNLYLCQDGSDRECLLQIGASSAQNGIISRIAFVLGELKQRADQLEQGYEKVKKDPKQTLCYDLGFPELVDSFVCPEQGDRRVNILGFRNVAKVSGMVPLYNLTKKDRLRVDLRTSAWILGKGLKMLVFAHECCGMAVHDMTEENVLIDPEQHYVVVFDWAGSETFPTGIVPEEVAREDIAQLAKAVITVLGGNPETEELPGGGEEGTELYKEHLLRLARGSERSVVRAHKELYQILDTLWHGFYPFTTFPF